MSMKPANAEPIIAINRASKAFDDQLVVDNLTLTVANGEVVALLGQTGVGKTTILNMILGQIRPSSGSVVVDGCDPFKDYLALRGKVAVSFQSDRLIPWRTARGMSSSGWKSFDIRRANEASSRRSGLPVSSSPSSTTTNTRISCPVGCASACRSLALW